MNFASKQEIITEDEEIDVDDDESFEKTFNSKSGSLNLNKFSFSISNILSDSFGPKPVKIENGVKNLFRPFDINNFICNNTNNSVINNPSSVFLSNFRLSKFFGTKNITPQSKNDNNSLSVYPKIHEEIINSSKRYTNSHPASTLLSTPSKILPLGGLSKTISQIGQENVTHQQHHLLSRNTQIH